MKTDSGTCAALFRLAAILFITVVCTLPSCKNDLDILADYRDTTIVYGLINAADTIQYIRIHKSFLGEGNALSMAQFADSFYYDASLEVKIEEYNNGNKVRDIACMSDSSLYKEPGIFAQTPNVVYSTSPNTSFNENYIYRLVINQPKTGKIATSESPVLGKLLISKPANQPVNFLDDPYQLQWYTIPNAKLYEVVIRFHYFEQQKANPQIIAEKYFDWKAANEIGSPSKAFEIMTVTLGKEDFFRTAAANIAVDTAVKRIAGNLEFIFTAGTEELYNYYKINNFTINLAQHIPDYTNINGGLGIFTSRRKEILTRYLDGATVAELKTGNFTKDLGF